MKLVNTLSLFLFFNILCYSQTTFKNEYSSKIVFFNDLKLKEVLNEIILKKKHVKMMKIIGMLIL
jgi:hypothetical protein